MREKIEVVFWLGLFGILIAFATSSCTLFGDRIASEVANVIDDYCQESQAQRAIYRDQVNAELAAEGHRISISCAGDTPDP